MQTIESILYNGVLLYVVLPPLAFELVVVDVIIVDISTTSSKKIISPPIWLGLDNFLW